MELAHRRIRVYMSTDGSGDEAEESKVTIDPDSDDGHKPRTRKQIAWTTRPPMYRSHIVGHEICADVRTD